MTYITKITLLGWCYGASMVLGLSSNSVTNLATNSQVNPATGGPSINANPNGTKLSTAPQPKTPQALPPSPAPKVLNNANASCTPLNLNAQTWNKLNLDKYLAEYPNGNNLTLSQYAESKNAQNFRCGIEEFCTIGQMCNPVGAPDWYILLAAQEWNNCMNSVYKAVHFSVSTVQGTLAMMVSGLAERNMKVRDFVFDGAVLAALVASAAATLALGVSALFAIGYLVPYGFLLTFGVTSIFAGMLASTGFSVSSLLGEAPPDKKSFMKWSGVGNAFSQWEATMHSMITNTTQTVINSPISSGAGISGVLRNGSFLFETQLKSTSELQIEYETVLQARSLVFVLRAMGAYITRGSDKCDQKGPNGAREGNEYLSYCGPDKVMMNIVLARGDKTKNKIRNAKYIASKFGFTTEYIVTQSWNCQQKYQKFQYDPYLHGPLPSDPNSDCVMNLPVCDLTDMKIEKARHGRHHHLTKACRVQGGLPI
ncbi:hypothetical protein O181_041341 [Austropuccinia psidii MF-1]|uniref:DUF7872 domain-containing protein n=1 Tax=Austropuccinia psidii MF-1 TaxID=1389203 RepID=A0A9Q3HE61_9BASI|nr:hypothetical protein [Austropuccinia psidii MF-1]